MDVLLKTERKGFRAFNLEKRSRTVRVVSCHVNNRGTSAGAS